MDLSVPAEVDRLASAALDELGGVDILVNNAGIPKRRHVTQLDPETVESVMAINYLSPVRLTLRPPAAHARARLGTGRERGFGQRPLSLHRVGCLTPRPRRLSPFSQNRW